MSLAPTSVTLPNVIRAFSAWNEVRGTKIDLTRGSIFSKTLQIEDSAIRVGKKNFPVHSSIDAIQPTGNGEFRVCFQDTELNLVLRATGLYDPIYSSETPMIEIRSADDPSLPFSGKVQGGSLDALRNSIVTAGLGSDLQDRYLEAVGALEAWTRAMDEAVRVSNEQVGNLRRERLLKTKLTFSGESPISLRDVKDTLDNAAAGQTNIDENGFKRIIEVFKVLGYGAAMDGTTTTTMDEKMQEDLRALSEEQSGFMSLIQTDDGLWERGTPQQCRDLITRANSILNTLITDYSKLEDLDSIIEAA